MTTMTNGGILADGRRLLKLALRLDAVVTGANGLAYLALAKPLEDLLGLDAGHSVAIGVFLLVYAAAVWAISGRTHRWAVTAVIEANVVWSVLSVVAVATGWLSLNTVGNVWAIMQAVVVAGFAGVQYAALRRSR